MTGKDWQDGVKWYSSVQSVGGIYTRCLCIPSPRRRFEIWIHFQPSCRGKVRHKQHGSPSPSHPINYNCNSHDRCKINTEASCKRSQTWREPEPSEDPLPPDLSSVSLASMALCCCPLGDCLFYLIVPVFQPLCGTGCGFCVPKWPAHIRKPQCFQQCSDRSLLLRPFIPAAERA